VVLQERGERQQTMHTLRYSSSFFLLLSRCFPWCGLTGARGETASNALLVVFLFIYFCCEEESDGTLCHHPPLLVFCCWCQLSMVVN